MARTSERAAANRRMMRWRSATLTRDSSEKRAVNISVPVLGSGHSGATLGAMFTRTNAAAPRAGQCDARPRRGLTPYRPAQRFTCSSRQTAVATARLGHLRPCETPVQASAIHHPRLIAGNRCAVVICRRRSTTQHCRKTTTASADSSGFVVDLRQRRDDAGTAGRKVGRLNRQGDGKANAPPRLRSPCHRAGQGNSGGAKSKPFILHRPHAPIAARWKFADPNVGR